MLLGEWPVNASYLGFPCRRVVLHRVVLALCLGMALTIPSFPSDAFVGAHLDQASQEHQLSLSALLGIISAIGARQNDLESPGG